MYFIDGISGKNSQIGLHAEHIIGQLISGLSDPGTNKGRSSKLNLYSFFIRFIYLPERERERGGDIGAGGKGERIISRLCQECGA